MNIWFILMQFPAPREIFVNNDVVTLNRFGYNISVHSLRTRYKLNNKLIAERKLTPIKKTYNSLGNSFYGIIFGFLNPQKFFTLLYFIIKNHCLNLSHLLKSLILLPRVLQLFSEFEKKLPEVVHLYWAHYPSLMGYLVKKYYPKTILSMNFVAYDLHQSFKGSLIVADMADCVFSITKFDRKTLINLGISADKIMTIYHGLTPDIFDYSRKEKIKNRIVSVGAFIPGKNMDKVIMVFSRVQKKHTDVSLVILGDGPMMNEARKLVRELRLNNVIFMGHVSHKDVIEQMSVAEVFLFLSQNERIPNVVKEAMSQRCVCIISKSPGIEELIKSDDCGIVLKSNENELVCDEVDSVLNNYDLYSKITDNAFSFVKKCFNAENSVRKMLSAWQINKRDS